MGNSRFKRKGKSKFIMIEGYIIRSPAWQTLTPNDKATYLELKWRYDGFNNGRIGLGCRELAEALKSSKDTSRRSLERLMERGLIDKAQPSGFNVKNRTATEWRLTEYACDRSNLRATKDFMQWQPKEKAQAHHRDPEEKTQARQKDAQAHQKDSEPPDREQKQPLRRTTGTVRPDFADAQAHRKDTYSVTMGGGPETARPTSSRSPSSLAEAPAQSAGANPRTAYLLETSFLKRAPKRRTVHEKSGT